MSRWTQHPTDRALAIDLDVARTIETTGSPDGVGVGSRYFDRYWTPILGPTSTLFLLRANTLAGQRWSLREIFESLGVKKGDAARSTVERLVGRRSLELVDVPGAALLRVASTLPVLDARSIDRLPSFLAAELRNEARR